MATLKELMGDLKRGDGRQFFNLKTRQIFEPIYFSSPNWFGLCSDGYSYYFDENQIYWGFEEKPTFKKKIKLYRYILKNRHTNLYCVNHWQSDSPGNYHYDYQVVGTEEMEIEVDE
jgi:hypothetical protein